MRIKVKFLSLLLLAMLAFGAISLAQEETTQEETKQEETAKEETTEETTEAAESAEVTEEVVEVDGTLPVLKLGEKVMTLDEFNERFLITAGNIASQQGVALDAEMLESLQEFRPDYLDQLAVEISLLNEAEERGLSFSEEELDEQIEAIIADFESREEYEALIAEAGFENEDQLRRLIQENETIRLVVEDMRKNVEISDEDLQTFYDDNAEQFERPEEVCARHILLETEEEANEIVAQLEDGGDFATLAEENSTGPSAPQGGDLGCLTAGQTVPAFNDAAFAAEVDEVVGPVETQFGFHVIKVYDRKEAGAVPLEEVEDAIREELVAQKLDTGITELQENSGVEVLAENLGTFVVPERFKNPVEDTSDEETTTEATEDTEDETQTDEENAGNSDEEDDSSSQDEDAEGDANSDGEDGGEEDTDGQDNNGDN